MQAEDFMQLVDNPEFIVGIYNYCDRWCEKCAFINRCTVGTLEQLLLFGHDKNEAISMEEFTSMLAIATGNSLLSSGGEFSDEDLDDPMEDNEFSVLNYLPASEFFEEEEFKNAQKFVDSHPINDIALQYTLACYNWKQNMSTNFHLSVREAKSVFTYIGKPRFTGNTDLEKATASFAVVDWYSMLIAVKVKRALHSYYTDKNIHAADDYQTDYNGSAKVGLMAIKNSIEAYKVLLQSFPEEHLVIETLIDDLKELKKNTYLMFPNLDKFKRIGFDDSND